MLRSVKIMSFMEVDAQDGQLGHISDVYFSDKTWRLEYLVIDTGTLLPGRKSLISPAEINEITFSRTKLKLKKENIRQAPEISHVLPVSRAHERELRYFYGWPVESELEKKDFVEGDENPDLRSFEEVKGYHLFYDEGEIGRVDDFIVEDEDWKLNFTVVDTAKWLPAGQILVPQHNVSSIDWLQKKVFVNMSREEIENSPEYNPDEPVNKVFEEQLYDFYGRPK
ncbi:MAG: hypothetical protein GF398_04230 [Chitinivibrionales bacterium]|nr:hypothetical protein [Chitinivibrionales bacterium]